MELETSKKRGLKYLKLAKPGWLEILRNIEALSHVHKVGILRNKTPWDYTKGKYSNISGW